MGALVSHLGFDISPSLLSRGAFAESYDDAATHEPFAVLSAAHRVLICDELLRNITRFLAEPECDDLDEGRDALASMALVCSTLSRPALATLWHRLDGIGPLLSLFDNDASSHGAMATAVTRYASHVRDIELDSGTIPSSLLAESISPPFPLLRRLHWVVPSGAGVQPFAPFIVPTLSELRVDITSEPASPDASALSDSLVDALDAVLARRSALTLLDIAWIHAPAPSLSHSVLQRIASLTTLVSLSVSLNVVASPQLLLVLSTLPSLVSLELKHHGESTLQELRFQEATSGFTTLRLLRVDAPHPIALEILSQLPICTLEQCHISLQGSCSSETQATIVRAGARIAGPILHTLSLNFPEDAYTSDAGSYTPLSVAVLPSIRAFDLTDVRLAWLQADHITDELCRGLATSWPRLRTLHLQPIGIIRSPPPTMVTLRGLGYLAKGCPDLSDVVIQLNGAGEQWDDEAYSLSTSPNRRPVTLDLTTSLITSPSAAALYLRRCFPVLASVRFNKVEARMCGESRRTTTWDELCTALLSNNS
ncbi:hypothetical protein C8T65DRAFT_642526 [Cerioporus squamosus]|nr:hypothetical protein C8T65DRAFT_642526 [Cerioporus squamosus]